MEWLFSFGNGNGACIGKNFSNLEMSKVVPQLLRYYVKMAGGVDAEWKIYNYWFARLTVLVVRCPRGRRVGLLARRQLIRVVRSDRYRVGKGRQRRKAGVTAELSLTSLELQGSSTYV
jgi:hypothetical protein